MMRQLLLLIALVSLFFSTTLAQADDATNARAIVEKAVKALGGVEKLSKYKASTWKGKGKFFGLGEGIEYSGEWHMQPPMGHRVDLDLDINGMQLRISRALVGDKGWSKLNDEINDIQGDELEEEKHGLYVNTVVRLLPLLDDNEFQLTPLGESKVGNREVLGVKVSKKGKRDVSLYMDKETGLLLKTETKVVDQQAGGIEVVQETEFSNYQEADGIPVARKMLIKRDGKLFVDFEMSEYKHLEKLDEAVFNKPQ